MNNIVEKSVLDGTPMINAKNLGRWIDETNERLAAVEKKVENNVSVEFKPERVIFGCSYNRDIGFSAEVVDQKLYDKLEAKHEADCRLISEYDIENKKLERVAKESEFHINKLKEDLESWVKRYRELDYIYEKKNEENSRLEDRYRIHIADLKSKLFDLKNAEEERDHYKRLYSFKCDDYNKLLKENNRLSESNDNATKENLEFEGENDALSTRNTYLEKLAKEYKDLFHSLNHKHQNVVGEMKSWKERAIEAEKKLKETEEKLNDARDFNKMREDVFEANLKLKKTIEAKDREIGLLRAELDKYTKTEYECDDSWID